MDFGAIIKRAWQITWRYKALWVLGIFAGISGCQASSPGSGGRGWDTDVPRLGDSGARGVAVLESAFFQYLPAILAFVVALIAFSIVWAVLSIAARNGLIIAVNEIEQGREKRLGELWSLGFSRFWPVVGLGLLLNLPMFVLAMVVGLAVAVPMMQSFVGGRELGVQMIAPMCGSLAIGVPLILVLTFVLGILYLVGLRYVVIGGQGPIEAIRNSWSFFRIRFKDSALMYLLSGALNIAASLVLAVPIIAVFIALAFPAFVAISNQNWGALLAPVAGGAMLIVLVGWFYSAVWGTFTSSLWTLFFRRVVGLRPIVAAPAPGYYPASYPYPAPPEPPAQGAPASYLPRASAPPPEPVPPGPPVAGYGQPPAATPDDQSLGEDA